jgi:UDP-glucose-4-epimerase GalE
MSRIVVTGGAGYIGSHTVYFLRQAGYEIAVLDDLSRGYASNVPDGLLRRVSLSDKAAVRAVLEEAPTSAVIHFAALIAVGESTQRPESFYANNVSGSISLLEAMAEAGVSRIVFSSTAAVYGNPTVVPIPESHPYAPVNPYGETKVAVERLLHWMSEYRGIRHVILRYFNACGSETASGLGERHDPETHLIPLVLRAIKSGKPLTVFGDDYPTADGTCIRDYIHVSDLATAHLAALAHLESGGASDTFNVGTGSGFTVRQVLQAAERVTGQSVPHSIGPRRAGDPAVLVADASRLRDRLGWTPRYTDIDLIVQTAWEFEKKLG